ncbi:MAG: type II secretion system F family protein [Planctomycetota bacterium]
MNSNAPLLLMFGAAVLTALFGAIVLHATRWLMGPPDPLRSNAVNAILRAIGWTLIVGAALLTLAIALPISFLGWFVLAVVALAMLNRRWMARQSAMLYWLAMAAERGISLPSAAVALGRETAGAFGQKAIRLAERLESGMALSEASRGIRRVLPRSSAPFVAIGQRAGALPAALREAAQSHGQLISLRDHVLTKIIYALFVISILVPTTAFFNLKIVPQLSKIASESGAAGFSGIQTLRALDNAHLLGLWIAYLSPLFVLALFYVLLRYTGLITFNPPGFGWITRRTEGAHLLRALAVAVEHGLPMTDALEVIAEARPKLRTAFRVRLAARAVAGGRNWADALLTERLIGAAEHAVLQSAERSGNLPWAMREMAESTCRRLAYRARAIAQMLLPVFIVVVGAFILVIAYSVFITLVQCSEYLL